MRILLIGQGFISKAVARHLMAAGHSVLVLLPAGEKHDLSLSGTASEVVVTSLRDPRGVRAALAGMDAAIFLPPAIIPPADVDLLKHIQAARVLSQAAASARIDHLLYLSTLGAEPGSAFAFAKTAGVVEMALRRSGRPVTILRSGVPFGCSDHFLSSLKTIVRASPLLLLPKGGDTILHPIWVEDLAAAITLSVDSPPSSLQKVLEIGGPEHLSLREIVLEVASALHKHRALLSISFASARRLLRAWHSFNRRPPISFHWLDYLAADRIAAIDTLPREFGLLPERLSTKLPELTKKCAE